MNRSISTLAFAILMLTLVLIPLYGDRYITYLAAEIVIYSLFALSFNLLLGYGGMLSFGHAAYFAIGAYGCAIFLTTLQWPLFFAILGAVVISALIAFIAGYFCSKLSEVYFSMLTLAFGQLVWAVAFKWSDVTGGDTGFIGVAVPEFLTNLNNFYYFALVIVTVCAALMWVIVHSAYGYTLIAIRENRNRAEFIGINARLVQQIAFTLAGIFAGIAGALYTLFNHSVFVELAWWSASAEVLIMSILGGVGHFFGPIVGAITLTLLDRFVTEISEYWPTVLAVILICVLFFFPEGLTGIFKHRNKKVGANDAVD